MPTLDWIGKKAVENHHLEIPFRLLKSVPELSVGVQDSGNLIVQGDNLEALKALLPYYRGQVKCICIDPPYNTGNEGWVYNDNVNSPEIAEWLNKVVGADELTRHDRWLCMMYPRLQLLREFLRNDGVIFINIDDNEYANLKVIMDEIFGLRNFIANIVVKMSHLSGVKMSHVSSRLPKIKEYVLMYAKDRNYMRINPAFEISSWDKAFSRYKSFLLYDDEDPKNMCKWKVVTLKEAYNIFGIDESDKIAKEKFCFENANRIFRTARDRSDAFLSLPRDNKFREINTATGITKIAYKRE